MESEAEAARMVARQKSSNSRNAEKSGETILNLVIEDNQTGLGGRYLMTLSKRGRQTVLPWNRLRVGSPIILSPELSKNEESSQLGYQGIVSARTAMSIQVALDQWPAGKLFRLDLSPDEVTRRRQRTAIKWIMSASGRVGQMREILLARKQPRFESQRPECKFLTDLNDSQQAAVRFALAAYDLAIIHGPPGTGKTTTVVELICQAVARGERVLACAPSNTGVDNLLEKLVALNQNVVRLGHPARVHETLREHVLDIMVENHEAMDVIRDMNREAERLLEKAERYTRARPEPGRRQDLRREARDLKSQAKLLERRAVDHILDSADIVLATNTFDEELIGDRRFDLAVIDEACQSTEPGCWIPVLHANRLVLAGDHCQLPPTVLSEKAAGEGFACSMMERLVGAFGQTVTRRLNVQYRMHRQIMDFSSQRFYEGSLVADPSVAQHLLSQLPGLVESNLTQRSVVFIDTAGTGWEEELEPDGESKRNPGEGKMVLHKVRQLVDAGLDPNDIAVIAPYAAQVRWLRQNWEGSSDLEIDTVDGFQGREKEAVIISTVRSNREGTIGFLADTRRMNVALTRARRTLIVVGDSSTLACHPFFEELLAYFDKVGGYDSAWNENLDHD